MRKDNGDVGTYVDLAQRVLAPVGSFNEMATRSVERAVRFQYEMAGDWMQFAFAQLHAAAASRDPGTLLTNQAEVSGQPSQHDGRKGPHQEREREHDPQGTGT